MNSPFPPFPNDFLFLGFGCARLDGGWQRAQSLRLLDAAYDAGIRYFDTARMYASGEAEGVLGEFLSRHRDGVIVTSKAGILPTPNGVAIRMMHRAAKLASQILPLPPPAPLEPRFGVFDVPSLKRSVETSLRELRRDRIDALLLHEVDETNLSDGTVMALLEELQKAGKIGAYGIASTRAQTQRLVAHRRFPIVQTASTVLEDGLAPLGDRSGFFSVTHSVLAGALETIMKRLSADDALREQWTSEIAVDPADREAVAGLLLAEAMDSNRGGIALFSSASPARIAAAARIARDKPYAQMQIAHLRAIAAWMSANLYVA